MNPGGAAQPSTDGAAFEPFAVPASAATAGPRRGVVNAALLVLVWGYCALTILTLHFRFDYAPIDDGAYHVGMARLLRAEGIRRDFPWTQLSVWNTRFADKEFLFHVALVPFSTGTPDEAIRGGKLFLCLLAIAVIVCFSLILRSHGVPGPWLWTFVLLVSSAVWLFRMSLLRPHVLSVALVLIGIHLYLRRRDTALAVLGFVYAWSYSAPHLLVGVGVVVMVCRRVADRTWEWKPLAAAALGLAAGFVINPYFPNNLLIWWIQNPLVLLRAWGISGPTDIVLGDEFLGASTRTLTHGSALALFLFVTTNLAAAFSRKRPTADALIMLALAWCFFCLELLSARFAEYLVPVTVMTAAFMFRDLRPGPTETVPRFQQSRVVRFALGSVVALVLFGSNYLVNRLIFPVLKPGQAWCAQASEWTRTHVPPGQTILHLGFEQFPELFLRDPGHRYLVAMDPMFGYYSFPKESVYLSKARFDRSFPLDPRDMAGVLHGRYLIVDKNAWRRGGDLVDRGARIVYDDERATVFDLQPAG